MGRRFWASQEAAKEEKCECVCPTSPARLLAKSLTDPETRGEWEREFILSPYAYAARYTNKSRDLVVSVGSGGVTTPFSLNDAEKNLVAEAARAFAKWKDEEKEAAALARLTAPKAKNYRPSSAKPRSVQASSAR